MEKITSHEKPFVTLDKAGIEDISILLELEKSVAGNNMYSPMLDENEWKEELYNSEVFLIKKDNTVLGNVSYELKPDSSIYISGLVINPSFQGQGIAREVLVKLLEKFKDKKRIDLVTHPDNHAALHLYQSLGFVIESQHENYYGDGEPRLRLVFAK
jgi:ribosomal protein S18 acetylase RimI-like enzyme